MVENLKGVGIGALFGLVVGGVAGVCLAELPGVASWIQSQRIHGGNMAAYVLLLLGSAIIGTLLGAIIGGFLANAV